MSHHSMVKLALVYINYHMFMLARTRHDTMQRINHLSALVGLAYSLETSEEMKNRWRQALRELARLYLEYACISKRLETLYQEIQNGNILTIPRDIKEEYIEIMTKLDEIEGNTITALQYLVGEQVPISLMLTPK